LNHNPEQLVESAQLWSSISLLEDSKLLPKNEVLQEKLFARPKAAMKRAQQMLQQWEHASDLYQIWMSHNCGKLLKTTPIGVLANDTRSPKRTDNNVVVAGRLICCDCQELVCNCAAFGHPNPKLGCAHTRRQYVCSAYR
jgi:hypothetical protein